MHMKDNVRFIPRICISALVYHNDVYGSHCICRIHYLLLLEEKIDVRVKLKEVGRI